MRRRGKPYENLAFTTTDRSGRLLFRKQLSPILAQLLPTRPQTFAYSAAALCDTKEGERSPPECWGPPPGTGTPGSRQALGATLHATWRLRAGCGSTGPPPGTPRTQPVPVKEVSAWRRWSSDRGTRYDARPVAGCPLHLKLAQDAIAGKGSGWGCHRGVG